jgi:transcription elongation factor GreA
MAVNKEIILTQEGVENFKKEYRHLIDVDRPAVIEALQNARAMGDLSENADYKAARDRQAEIEDRIKELESILANAKIANVDKKDKSVSLGKTVTFTILGSGKQLTVAIVSSEEAAPLANASKMKISTECAVGMALVGHKAGDVVTVKTNKPYEIKIDEVKVTDLK